jgi:DNA-3-methyladenine glycosylase II
MFLMFNLQHPDVLPVTDLGVRKGVALHFGLPSSTANKGKQLPSPEKMEEVTEIWKPYRTMGSWLMWRSLDIKISADE